MAKICEIELVGSIGSKPYDLSHGVHECRLAIGREAHDLVFVAVMRKAQILRQRLIEDAERMREIHASVDGDGLASADPPRSAGEVAEAVDRDDDGFGERRNMEGRGKMREMMLDPVHLAMKALSREARCQQLLDAPARSPVPEPVENEREVGTVGRHIGQLPEQIGPAVLIDGDVPHIGEPDARFAQTIGDRLRREAGPMLDAAESLLLRRRNEHAVAHERGRGIAVECVEAENDHRLGTGTPAAPVFSSLPRPLPVPPPGVADDSSKIGPLRGPAEQLARPRGIGNQDRRIAGPAWCIARIDLAAGDGARRVDHLAHRCALPAGQIDGDAVAPAEQVLESEDMRPGEIGHVHVVADRRSVRGVVIRSEYLDSRPCTRCRLQDQRDEMGLGAMVLPDLACRFRARGIEVAQPRRLESVRAAEIIHHALAGELGEAIRIDWIAPRALDDRNAVRLAINGAARREHDQRNSRPHHRIEQHPRPMDVHVVISAGHCHRLADIGERGEMHHRLDAVGAEQKIERRRIPNVAFDQWPPADELTVAEGEIVEYDHFVAGCRKCLGAMAADVAGAAGDENGCHG